MGTYWAGLSSPHVINVVENSDLMIFAGAVLNDYTTVGWTALINPKTTVEMFPFKVIVCGKLYINVVMADLLNALAAKGEPLKTMRIVDDTGSLFTIPPVEFEAAEIGLKQFGFKYDPRKISKLPRQKQTGDRQDIETNVSRSLRSHP